MKRSSWLTRFQNLPGYDKGLLLAGLVAFHWLAFTSHKMVEYFLHHGWHGWNFTDLSILLFSAAFTWFVFVTISRRRHSHIRVVDTSAIRFCENLILFLSSYQSRGAVHRTSASNEPEDYRDTPEWQAFMGKVNAISGDLADNTTLEKFESLSWRMPLKAIGHHIHLARTHGDTLRGVAVITSSDDPHGQMLDGTFRQFSFFKKTVERLLPVKDRPTISHVTPEGCNFEDPESISAAVNKALSEFEGPGSRSKVIIDVTGGTKHCSIVGGVLSLEAGRIFQYTTPRAVRSWDIRYVPPHDRKPEPTD